MRVRASGNEVPVPPSKDDVPSRKAEVDEATVYTYAIAWVKTDELAEGLAGAKFKLPFYVKRVPDYFPNSDLYNDSYNGSYVYAFDTLPETFEEGDSKDNYTNEVETFKIEVGVGADGKKIEKIYPVITIKGLEQGTYSIEEVKAPQGYNLLEEPFSARFYMLFK